MAREQHQQLDLSARRIVGFACNQAFTFFLFYMGVNRSLGEGEAVLERADLALVLLFMVVGFAVARLVPAGVRNKLFARPLLYVYAVVMAAGSLVPLSGIALPGPALLTVQGLLVGVSCAFLLTAWGRAFGCAPTAYAVPEVFVGSLVAAFVCLLFALAPAGDAVSLAFRLLPLASVVNIEVPASVAQRPATVEPRSDEARELSGRMLVGTALFGMTAGLMETFATEPGGLAAPHHAMSFVVFGAFLIGGLSLLLSDAFDRGAALNKSYRLAVFIMMMGVLVLPWSPIADSPLPGQAIVLSGYLGLEAVLVSLFLVLASIMARDAAESFSSGFAALFAGEFVGVVVSNVASAGTVTPYGIVVLAGAIALLSYVFLFTERDFDELSQIVNANDAFEQICAGITEGFGLSNRESEILAYALRGRTADRIARELVISKSTVDTHLRRIYSKCGVHSRQELLDLAERR